MNKLPPVHLWIYNHPFFGISDQIEYFVEVFRQHGYEVTVGKQPSRSALNVVIENFSAATRKPLQDFCRSHGRRVGVIMTEHIDFHDDALHIHGEALGTSNDYMHPATQMARLEHLFACAPEIRCFFVLGDLPKLAGFDLVLPGIEVFPLAFPGIEPQPPGKNYRGLESDFLFTGYLTEHRMGLVSALRKQNFEVCSPPGFVSRRRRAQMTERTRLVLNLPQRIGWKWLSSMRIMAALRSGRATVSIGTSDQSEISACTYQVDMDEDSWTEKLSALRSGYEEMFEEALSGYLEMARDFENLHRFPHALLDSWAITDRL